MFSWKKVFFKSLGISFFTIAFIVVLAKVISIIFVPIKITKSMWKFFILFYSINTISNTLWHRPKIEVIHINDKNDFIINLRGTLNELNWKIIKEEKDVFEIKPNFSDALFCKSIIVKVYNNEAELIGSKTLIEKLIWRIKNNYN